MLLRNERLFHTLPTRLACFTVSYWDTAVWQPSKRSGSTSNLQRRRWGEALASARSTGIRAEVLLADSVLSVAAIRASIPTFQDGSRCPPTLCRVTTVVTTDQTITVTPLTAHLRKSNARLPVHFDMLRLINPPWIPEAIILRGIRVPFLLRGVRRRVLSSGRSIVLHLRSPGP